MAMARLHDYIQEMNMEVLSKYDMMTVEGSRTFSTCYEVRWPRPKKLDIAYHFESVDI
jgi:hypothetical protein